MEDKFSVLHRFDQLQEMSLSWNSSSKVKKLISPDLLDAGTFSKP